MKTILILSFFLLLLMSCNNEKEETYPVMNIHIDTINNVENRTIHLRYKDSSTMARSGVNILTKEKEYHSFYRRFLDGHLTSYTKMKTWHNHESLNDKDSSYYYSENVEIQHYNRDSTIETNNSVQLISKNKISYQKKLELLAWPMNQLMFISAKKDSLIIGSYRGDSISYQYKIQPYSSKYGSLKYSNYLTTRKKEDGIIILENTNDTIYMKLIASSLPSYRNSKTSE